METQTNAQRVEAIEAELRSVADGPLAIMRSCCRDWMVRTVDPLVAQRLSVIIHKVDLIRKVASEVIAGDMEVALAMGFLIKKLTRMVELAGSARLFTEDVMDVTPDGRSRLAMYGVLVSLAMVENMAGGHYRLLFTEWQEATPPEPQGLPMMLFDDDTSDAPECPPEPEKKNSGFPEQMGDVSIEYMRSMGLTGRAILCLSRAGIKTLDELMEWPERSLRQIRGVGDAVMASIRDTLAKVGLTIKKGGAPRKGWADEPVLTRKGYVPRLYDDLHYLFCYTNLHNSASQFYQAGIKTIGELLECTETDVLLLRGIGPATMTNLEMALGLFGFSLAKGNEA